MRLHFGQIHEGKAEQIVRFGSLGPQCLDGTAQIRLRVVSIFFPSFDERDQLIGVNLLGKKFISYKNLQTFVHKKNNNTSG